MFDIVGLDPLGAEKTIKFIKEYINKGGAAILLDNFEDSEPYCTKYIKAEMLK